MSAVIQAFDRAALQATPWRNGGGLTREIACVPPGAGLDGFDWRISIARIDRPGPFSEFTGVDRQITLLEGAGVLLRPQGEATAWRLDQPGRPLAFAGECPLWADLLGGPCEDLNVMTRRTRCRSEVLLCSGEAPSRDLPAAPAGLLLAWRGDWQLQGGAQDRALPEGRGLWWHGGACAWSARAAGPDSALICVRIEQVDA